MSAYTISSGGRESPKGKLGMPSYQTERVVSDAQQRGGGGERGGEGRGGEERRGEERRGEERRGEERRGEERRGEERRGEEKRGPGASVGGTKANK